MKRSLKMVVAGLVLMHIGGQAAAQTGVTAVGSWDNVVSFTINPSEDHIVMTMLEADGSERAYESTRRSGQWGGARPIEALNSKCGAGENVGGICMTDNEQRIYFHANYAGGVGGYDIYYSDLTADGWGEPVLDATISTTGDETYPSVINGLETIYVLRHQVVSDMRKEKKEADRQSVYFSHRDAKGKWSRALPVNNVVNVGFVQDMRMSADRTTMFYTLREDKKEQAKVMYAKEILANEWTIPEVAAMDESGYDYFSPCYAEGKLYVLKSNTKKRVRSGKIVAVACADKYKPWATVNELGEVIKKGAKTPVESDVTVYNPTTMGVLGRYKSSSFSGLYDLTNRAGEKYIVDVRGKGYSYASYQLDYTKDAKRQLPRSIVLFDTIELVMNVYDSEIFRQLESKVVAVRQSDKAIFRSVKRTDGKYSMKLPLGSNYNVIATAKGFAENKFMFRLEGDIVFSSFERELALDPQKTDITVTVLDAETKAPLSALVELKNLNRDEMTTVKPGQMTGGEAKTRLRTGDKYEMTVKGVKGYSFHTRTLMVESTTAMTEEVELIPLRENAAVRLNNINFETASADIMPESYEELNRLLDLMNQNPGLRFEISAHTDNVGAASYNMLLSDRRAQSVAAYLVESGMDPNRLVTKGYGMSQPLLPNTSDENRAQNRRVEFKMIASE